MDLNRASNVDEQYLKNQLRKIARDIVGVEQRINVIERVSQAPYRSVSGGTTVYYDSDGEVRHIVGAQPDGSYTSVDVNGPPAPSPPSRPIIETRAGSVIVSWDGKMENGSTMWPADFDHVEVHIATDDFFVVGDDTEIATYNTRAGGSISISLEPDTYYWVKLVQVNKSNVRSLESEEVNFYIEEIPYGIKTYRQDTAPTDLTDKDFGAIWYDTDDGNRQRFWDGDEWVDVSDQNVDDALQAAEEALTAAQQRVKLSYSATRPTGLFGNDRVLWMDPNNGYAAEFWNGVSWSPYFFGPEAVGFDARDIGGILTSVGLAAPSNPITGDIWYNASQNNRPEVWNGTQWVIVRDGTIEAAALQAAQALADATEALSIAEAAQATADGSIRTYYQSDPPWANGTTQPDSVLGDMWFDQDDGQAYRWNGTNWQLIEDSSIAVALAAAQSAQATADGKINSYYSTIAPTLNGEGVTLSADDTGDLWFDTDNGNKTSYWTGSAWAALPTGRDALATDVVTSLDGAVKTYVVEYSVNSSETVAPTTGWSTTQPTRAPGTFVWFRTTVTRNDNSTSTTSPALLTGNTGATGAAAATVVLTATAQVLTAPAAGGATNPTTSTVTGAAFNTTITAWTYSVDGAAFSATVPTGVSRTGNVVTVTGSTMTARTIAVRAADANGVADTLTVARVLDGASGGAGADGYTVLLTNEAHTFAGGVSAANAGSTTTSIIAYKGGTQIAATVGTITGQVTGLTTAIINNGATTAGVTITVTTALTQQSGTLTIPLTIDGKSFTKTFAWSVSRTGATGAAAPDITLTASSQALVTPAAGGATTPATSTVTGTVANTTITTWDYSVDGGTFSTTVPTGASRTGSVVTITGATMTARTITVRASDAGGVADTLTVAKVSDGAAGGAGGTGPAGADAYTVLLTNEANVFPGSTTAALAGSAATQVIAYKGATQMAATIGTVTGQVTGLTTAITNNGTTTATLTITVTTSLTALNGTLTVPVTVDGQTFTKTFSWSVSRTGATGSTGVSVTAVTPFYAQVTTGAAAPAQPGAVATPPAPWVATEPAYVAGTELYRTERISYSNGTYAYTAVFKSSAYDAAIAAMAVANTKITTYSGATDPAAQAVAGDMWLKPETINSVAVNTLYRRNDADTAWVKVDDPAAQQAIADAAAAANLADSKMKIYPQDAAPTGLTASDNGDLWIDTNDGNKTYRYLHGSTAGTNGAGGAGPWISILDTSLASIQYVDQQVLTSANGKNKSTYSTGVPGTTANIAGDIWFQYDGSNRLIGQWRGTGGTGWTAVTIENQMIATLDAGKINTGFLDVANRINAGSLAIGQVANLQTTLNTKVSTFTTTGASPTTPTALTAGDIWIHTNNGLTKIYRATAAGTASWVVVADDTSTPTTFVQSAIPTSVAAGDVWIDTDDGKMYRAAAAGATTIAAGGWILFNDPATAGNRTFAQTSIPTSTAIGDIWVDTDDSNKIYTAAAAGATTIAAGGWVLRTDLTTKTRTYMQTAVPTSSAVGDSWIDTDDNNKLYVANATGVSTIVTTGSGWYLVQDAAGARAGAMQDIQNLWGHPANTTFIDGGDIFTNTVRARQLLLMDVNNYLSDPNFIDNSSQSWEFGAGAGLVVASAPGAPGYLSMNAAAINTNLHTGDASFWATEPGTEYVITGEFTGDTGNTGTTTFYPAVQVQSATNTTLSWPQAPISVGVINAWTPFTLNVAMPANAARFRWHGFLNATVLNNKAYVRGIKIRRKNAGSLIVDGTIEAGKLAANSVVAGNVVAGEITSAKLSTDAIDGKTITGAIIRTAAEGARLELTTSGLIQLDASGNVVLSIGDQNKFTGEVDATSIVIRDSLQLFGRNNLFATGSKIVLKATTGDPSQAPTLSWDYEAGPDINNSTSWYPTAVHSVGGVLHSATYVFLGFGLYKRADGKYWQFPSIPKPGGGTYASEFKPWSMVRIAKSDTGAERVVMIGEDYNHIDANGYPETWMRVYDDSTLNTSGTVAPVLKAQWKVTNFNWLLEYRLGRHVNGTTDRNKWVLISVSTPLGGGDKTLKWAHYAWHDIDNVYSVIQDVNMGAVIPANTNLAGGAIGSRSGLQIDTTSGGNATDFMLVCSLGYTTAVHNISASTWEFDSYWDPAWNPQDRFWTDGNVVNGTATNYYTYNFATGTDIKTFKYTNSNKRGGVGFTNIWASYSWLGEASSGFKTVPSPRTMISYRRRGRLRITMPALPAPIAGVGQPRDPLKDVYGWQYYIAQSNTNPANVYLGPNNPALAPNTPLAVVSATQETFPTNSGTAPPSVTNFPASQAATIESDNGWLVIDGDGDITARDVEVDRLWVGAYQAGVWQSYSPSAVNCTLGTGGLVTGRFMRIEKTVHFTGRVRFGTGFTISNGAGFTLPFQRSGASSIDQSFHGQLLDVGSNNYMANTYMNAFNAMFYGLGLSGAFAPLNATVPFTWASGDELWGYGSYECV